MLLASAHVPIHVHILLQLDTVLLGAAHHKTHPSGYLGLNTALGLSVVCRGRRWDATKIRKATAHFFHSFLLGPEEQGDETRAPGDPSFHQVEVSEKTEPTGGPSLGVLACFRDLVQVPTGLFLAAPPFIP